MKTQKTEIELLEKLIQKTKDIQKYPYRFLYFCKDDSSVGSDFSYANYRCRRDITDYTIQIWNFSQTSVGVNLRTVDHSLCIVTHEDFDSIESLILTYPDLI